LFQDIEIALAVPVVLEVEFGYRLPLRNVL